MPKKRDPFRQATGKRLEVLRRAKDFDTIRGFAKELDIEEDRYTTWEKGKALIPPQVVENLRQRYGITSDWLYYGDGSGLPHRLYTELTGLKLVPKAELKK